MNKSLSAKNIAIQRLEVLMASKQSEVEAKTAIATCDERLSFPSDGTLFSLHTRRDYQRTILRFLNWCEKSQEINDHNQIDEQANELASLYLSEHVMAGYSAWTLKKERSVLRFYFQNKELAHNVNLPPRRRTNIVLSRRPAARDVNINLENWQHVIQFCLATGASSAELRSVRVCDIYTRPGDGQLMVRLTRNQGRTWREVAVFPGREQAVLSQIADLEQAPDVRLFLRISGRLDIQSYRRQFAQELYMHLSGRPLPPSEGRLRSADIDREAALEVSRRLGLSRVDAVYMHYLR